MYVKLFIPEKLKDLRVERRLTLEQLAAETGLSKSALGKYETDDYKDISPFAIATLANFYGVSTDYLMGRTETKNHPNTALHELHLSDDMNVMLDMVRLQVMEQQGAEVARSLKEAMNFEGSPQLTHGKGKRKRN